MEACAQALRLRSACNIRNGLQVQHLHLPRGTTNMGLANLDQAQFASRGCGRSSKHTLRQTGGQASFITVRTSTQRRVRRVGSTQIAATRRCGGCTSVLSAAGRRIGHRIGGGTCSRGNLSCSAFGSSSCKLDSRFMQFTSNREIHTHIMHTHRILHVISILN